MTTRQYALNLGNREYTKTGLSSTEQFERFVGERPFVDPLNPQLLYAGASMAFEAGEAGDVIKKISRGDKIDSVDFVLEAGDCLYYMTKALSMLGFSLDDTLKFNEKKLKLREELGKGPDKKVLRDWIRSEIGR